MSNWNSYEIIMMVLAAIAALAALIAIFRYFAGRSSPDTAIRVRKSPRSTVAGRNINVGGENTSGQGESGGKTDIQVDESEAANVSGQDVSKKS